MNGAVHPICGRHASLPRHHLRCSSHIITPSLSSLHPVSIICHTPHHHLFSPQLDIQARDRKDTIYQRVCLAWRGVIGIFTWPLSRRCLGVARVCVWRDVPKGVWGSRGCRGDAQNLICEHCIGLFWANLDSSFDINQVCGKCKKGVSLQIVYSHLVTIGTRARYRDDNSHLSSLTN